MTTTLKKAISALSDQWYSFYLYDEAGIQESIHSLKTSFPQIAFLYSVKCNANPNVLACIFSQGFGADAASAGEVELARQAGLSASQIYYSAPGKSIHDIERTIEAAILIADSLDEIKRIQAVAERLGKTIPIGIRINPDFSFLGNVGSASKFGIDENQLIDFLRKNPYPNIRVTGIHVHLKSQELNAEVIAAYYERVFSLAERMETFCGELAFVNMGSGMGIQYAPTDSPLDVARLVQLAEKRIHAFQAAHENTKIIIEVGRFAVGKSGYYVTKVMDRKVSYGKTYLILKNTLNGFIRPSLARLVEAYSSERNPVGSEPLFTSVNAFQIDTLKDEAPSEKVTLVGNLCTAADVVAKDVLMPHLECGDAVILTNAGSYAAVLSPMQFSSQEPPKELFLTKDGVMI